MDYLIKNIEKLSKELFKELRTIHRYLHKHPELGRQKYRTSEFIRNKIAEIGKFKITMVGKTGFTADLVQPKSYPWLALRADMDALPIKDEKMFLINLLMKITVTLAVMIFIQLL